MKIFYFVLFTIFSFTFLQAQDNFSYTVEQLTDLQHKAANEGNFELAANYKKAVQLKKDINLAITAEDYALAGNLKKELNALPLITSSNKSSNYNLKLEDVCPGDLAQEYKTKMINAGSNTEASGAYGGIATYYAYKCECEFGTERGANLLDIMNGLVRTNETYYKNKYGTIETVSSCKNLTGGSVSADNSSNGTLQQNNANSNYLSESIKNQNIQNANKIAQQLGLDANQTKTLNIIASSGNMVEMNKRLQEHNIQQISDLTAQGLNQMLGDNSSSLPISSDDITNLLNGDIENVQTAQNIHITQNALNVNSQEAELINNSLMMLSEGMAQEGLASAQAFIDYTNKYKIVLEPGLNLDNINSYKYSGDFNDENWQFNNYNGNLNFEIISSNEIEIKIFEKKPIAAFRNNDFEFLTFFDSDFSLFKDFEISFEVATHKMPKFSFFISNPNKFVISSTQSYLINSFTPMLNEFNSTFHLSYLEDIDKKLNANIRYQSIHPNLVALSKIEDYRKICTNAYSYSGLYSNAEKLLGLNQKDFYEYFSLSKHLQNKQREQGQITTHKEMLNERKKLSPEERKKAKEYVKSLMKNENIQWSDQLYDKYFLIKTGDKLIIKWEKLVGDEVVKGESVPFDYKYIDKNKLFFGLAGGFSMRSIFDNSVIRIKNFTIKQ